jgi:hypothetical protein
MSFDNNMQVIVSKVVSDKTNAPTLRVNTEINGQKYKAGLWLWKRKDGTTVTDKAGNAQYKGTLEVDDYEANTAPPPPPQDDDEFGDSIPF